VECLLICVPFLAERGRVIIKLPKSIDAFALVENLYLLNVFVIGMILQYCGRCAGLCPAFDLISRLNCAASVYVHAIIIHSKRWKSPLL
jgi:hypothetical protein